MRLIRQLTEVVQIGGDSFQHAQHSRPVEPHELGCWGATEQKSGIGKCSESNNLSFSYLQASILLPLGSAKLARSNLICIS
jgi:hypothetical protein